MKNDLKGLFFVFLSVLILSGCADIVPKPNDIVQNPIGPHAVKIGMTQQEVSSIYGDPDIKSNVRSTEWGGGAREEWFYHARISALPVGSDYLTNDLYLYFDSGRLTNISKKPLGITKKDTVDENKSNTDTE